MPARKYRGDARERAKAAEQAYYAKPGVLEKRRARQRTRKQEWRAENPELNKERQRESYARHRFDRKAKVREDLHGISPAEYDRLFIRQEASCAICMHMEWAERNGRVFDLAVDHDHHTGNLRGLLCGKCNIGLGFFRDEPQLLRRAADYIEKHMGAL